MGIEEYLSSKNLQLELIGLCLLKQEEEKRIDEVIEWYNREIDSPTNSDELRDGMAEFQFNRKEAMV